MKKNILLQTNIFIGAIIVLGFILTSLISYHLNNSIYIQDIEHISTLTSEGIYHQIDSIFTKPINISLTMANDNLLKSFMQEEENHQGDEEFIQTMRDYLLTYKEKYGYDSVFLVSAQTDRYYHFDKGIDRVLSKEDAEDQWYYSFLESSKEYSLNIDNDETQIADNEITIFINCKIFSNTGEVMGVVGVGLNVNNLQTIFQKYEKEFDIKAYLIDGNGTIEISTSETGYEKNNLFADNGFTALQDHIFSDNQHQSLWFSSPQGKNSFIVSTYVENLEWYLIICNDATTMKARLNRQILMGIMVILFVITLVLLIISKIFRKYNAQIISLTKEKEKMHRSIFQTETEKLYENIYELDVTHNKAASEATESYFESLGVPKNLPYDQALWVIAAKQIKEEYREGYIHTFFPQNVLNTYKEGKESLHYDFLITNDGGNTYYWMRIIARIFYWKEDQSVRMLTYRRNIDEEKRQELLLTEKMLRDSLSGLYNKAATQELIGRRLKQNQDKAYAFFILDIDDFKRVNDTCGHAVGDLVISDFSQKLKQQFPAEELVGRIGGDEFVVFALSCSEEWVIKKADHLSQILQYRFSDGTKDCQISASIGIAIAPEAGTDFEVLYKNADQALYHTKENGKHGYTIYGRELKN